MYSYLTEGREGGREARKEEGKERKGRKMLAC